MVRPAVSGPAKPQGLRNFDRGAAMRPANRLTGKIAPLSMPAV
jgi:hypothetical protein